MPEIPEQQPELPDEREISLDELSEAFALVMGGEPPTAVAGDDDDTATTSDEISLDEEPTADEEDACEVCPRTILEGMLFVGNPDGRPLAARHAADLMRGVEPEEIDGLVEELNVHYAANRRPYRVVAEGGGYRLALRPAFEPLRNRFYGRIREARLSQAAIDVLAIAAYQQPLTSEEISRLRGKPSGHVLAQLVRRGLLRIERASDKGRTAHYHTTDRFLQLFGLDGLGDLPQSEDIEGQ